MAPHPEGLRWYQIPLSSARIPRSGLFSYGFQASLQRYQQLRALKNLRVGRPVAPPPPGLLEPWPPGPPPANSPPRVSHRPRGAGRARVPWHPKAGTWSPLHCPHSPHAPRRLGEAWSPLHCPHGPPPAPRGPPVTPTLSPRLSLSPKGICGDPCAVPTAPRRPKKSPGTRKRVSRGQQPPGSPQPHANRQDAASQGSPGCRVAPDSSGHVPVLPEAAGRSLGGEANHGQRPAAGTVPQQAGRSFGGQLPGTTGGTVSPTDSEDDDLIPLKDMLLAGDEPLSSADHQQVVCPQPDPLANSLDSLIREKREQSQAAMLQASLAWVHVDDASASESPDEDTQLPEEYRDLLARFTTKPRFIPAVHPGEPVFCAHPAPAPTLDTQGLQPQSVLERFFLCNSPACQAAFVRNGGLSLLYRCAPTCPLPVLRWLFQLMTLCPDTTNASQALWEIWLTTGGEPWCPTVQEIGWAIARLGADLSPLRRQRLVPPELCPTERRNLDPSCSPRQASPDATSTLALVTQLGDICKFLALCLVTQPCRYADSARLALVTLLSFLGLDRALRCQPLPELQHLLHCLLEGIRDWQEQLPALCLSLCQLSRHHHNLVALMRLLPDLTSRGRYVPARSAATGWDAKQSWQRWPARRPVPPAPRGLVTGSPAGAGTAPRHRARAGRAGMRLPLIPLFQTVAQAQSGQDPAAGTTAPRHGCPEGTGVTPALRGRHRGMAVTGAEAGTGTRARAGPSLTLFPFFPGSRRHLSLHAMARLLREPPCTVPPPGAHAELQVLGRFLVLAQPDTLRRLVLAGGLEEPEDADQEACYLSYSLLLLASNVVGSEHPPAEQRGHLEQLCAQLDRHFGRGLREGSGLLFRTQLKGLAALLYVKWQEMLA
ncbi:LOW QUALITY PROTEIN: protein FAM178B [Harpia harpyja]|uniref:LOW QUALITY PROTEIN: protein FAM178B n=1 Tax=Harpia harpyja TaxID=202280 RepID=UPI0022B17995|nr:LOW QUALITY PROTEIN: protein FAM178B [Harpia harpyja]